jgi:agmatinase
MKEVVDFDPNALASKDLGIYGLPFDTQTARTVLLPVPWEVTVSYGAGTAVGPESILKASAQVDLFDPDVADAWKIGLAMDEIPTSIKNLNDSQRKKAELYIKRLEAGEDAGQNAEMGTLLNEINTACEEMNSWVESRAAHFLDQNKLVGLIGGDHSTPLGLIRELGKRHEEFGILHFDAHADLRDAYEGFKFSHASIMFNVLAIKSMNRLVQVGIRDYCEDEANLIRNSDNRVIAFYDRDIKSRQYEGEKWRDICDEIVSLLPPKIYVSFDIDGLDPKFCPNTGTPVPGGMELEEALYLIRHAVRRGKQIIGFDLNEVACGADEWDANVGARLLYRMANLAAASNDGSLHTA